ncbi:hypothetical protein VTP01DRAFT_4285 [Rhizomucor pusillus]|uniref:uncharacterized protein n=1 Tax=Rhizomucor pusillus TaxID=4840 RepID=UPI003742BFB7
MDKGTVYQLFVAIYYPEPGIHKQAEINIRSIESQAGFLPTVLEILYQDLEMGAPQHEHMSIQFFYEDGEGNAVDDYGRPEPMDYVVDEEQYALETLSSYTQYLHNRTRESDGRSDAMETDDVKKDVDVRMREASIKRVYTLYTDQDKVRYS